MIEKTIKKMEKQLKSMEQKGFDVSVISAQKTAIEEKKQLLEKQTMVEESRQGGFNENTLLTFSVVDDETHNIVDKQYKVAFVKNNRPIDNKKVDGFIHIIATGKYEQAYPIIAMSAEEVIATGKSVTNAKGHPIKTEEAKDYLVILDGQHRVLAFLKCGLTELQIVPNTFIKTGINIGEYLVDINDVGTSWSQKDRFAVAALVTDNELAHAIADRIDEGFNPTTSSLIYTGKKVTGKEVKKLLRGEEWTLPKGANLNIYRGNMFIQLCKEANISVKFITKRHLINGFNTHALSVGDDIAFGNLRNLKKRNLTEAELRGIKDETDFVRILTAAA